MQFDKFGSFYLKAPYSNIVPSPEYFLKVIIIGGFFPYKDIFSEQGTPLIRSTSRLLEAKISIICLSSPASYFKS
jgi:hypothetical protein